jgi:hypothetical protein
VTSFPQQFFLPQAGGKFTSGGGGFFGAIGRFFSKIQEKALGALTHMAIPGFKGAGGGLFGDMFVAIGKSILGGIPGMIRDAIIPSGDGGGPGGGTPLANMRLGQQMAAQRGWVGAQWSALRTLWQHESGWSNTARNPSSGAFGIPQGLPASKMGAAAAGGNARAQIAWGLSYIAGRYRNPVNAWNWWQGHNWYGSGLDAVFRKPSMIGVGEKGAERVTVTPVGRRGAGGGVPVTYNITVNASGSNGDEIAAKVYEVVAKVERDRWFAERRGGRR